jgi:hypothetical protein
MVSGGIRPSALKSLSISKPALSFSPVSGAPSFCTARRAACTPIAMLATPML